MSMTLISAENTVAAQEQRQFRAFVLDDDTRRVIEQVVTELSIPNASVHRGDIRQATLVLGEQRSPRLLVVDLTAVELPLSAVNELAEVCEPGVTLIATGDRNDVGLFRDLVNNGVSDYLVKPVTAPLLRQSLLSVMDSKTIGPQSERRGRLIAVVGSRGGVGTTMLATSIGWSIAQRRRRRVALVDLDLQQGTVALALDLEPAHGLRQTLEHPERTDGLFLERTMTRHSDTLYVLSGEESLDEPVTLDATWLDLMIREMRNKYHYVVADVPHRISKHYHYIVQNATNIVLVTDLSVAGMRDTLRQLTLFSAMNTTCQVTLVANRVSSQADGNIGIKEFQAAVGRQCDFIIPFDARVIGGAMNAGKPVAEGRGKIAPILQRIAEQVAGNAPAASVSRRFRFWPLTGR